MKRKFIVVGNVSDSYSAIDIADFLQQKASIDDLVSLKIFRNGEFCPRYTVNGYDKPELSGTNLHETTVIIISVQNEWISRNEMALRNMVLARAAKYNSAKRVLLVEPDLFYSAQDRGPKKEILALP